MNRCVGCGLDFGSVSAFDAYRFGKHEYLFLEGLDMTPPREDGRRCLDVAELVTAGWKQDAYDRWRQPVRDGGQTPSVRSAQSRRAPARAGVGS